MYNFPTLLLEVGNLPKKEMMFRIFSVRNFMERRQLNSQVLKVSSYFLRTIL
jgi:hypothetical protein